jgi:predicted dehydrogenase
VTALEGTADPIGVALVGYGYWGANLARNIGAADNLRLVGVADTLPVQRELAARANPGIVTWDSLTAALDEPEVQAVVIAAPAALHADLAREVLGAGRHVMVEKPLAMTAAHAEEIVALAASSNLVAMVGHTFLYAPAVVRLKEYVDSGELGAVQYLYSQRLSLGRIRRDCSALWNFAPHDVSILVHLLGELPSEVSATSLTMIGPEQADVFFAHLTFPSGVGAHLHVSWIDPRKQRLVTVVGDRKMAVYDDVSVDQKLTIVDAGVARQGDLGEYQSLGDFQWRTRAGDLLVPHIQMTEPLRLEMEAFGTACATGEAPVTSARHGADVVAVLEAIDRSAQAGGAPMELGW